MAKLTGLRMGHIWSAVCTGLSSKLALKRSANGNLHRLTKEKDRLEKVQVRLEQQQRRVLEHLTEVELAIEAIIEPQEETQWEHPSAGVLDGERFPCAFCKGKGILQMTMSRCPVCRGRGSVKAIPPVIECAYCRGQGEFPIGSNFACTVCGGKGVVSVSESVEICWHCRGTGVGPENGILCMVCSGKGVITAAAVPESRKR